MMANSRGSRTIKRARLLLTLPLLLCGWLPANAQENTTRKLSGMVVTRNNERVAGVKITVRSSAGEQKTESDAVYKSTLFSRDDQVFYTLDAGINVGQQEGGAKSLEIRRFGFNLDHGGVNGGLKALVDDVQQNQGTQGHGQGYLATLKALTPELIDEVDILNGPFNAAYGDFSGLGVVHIRLKESLPDRLTLRLQGGSFDSYRTFLGYSPNFKSADGFIAYEGSYINGPFKNPMRYKRNNLTGNFTRRLDQGQAVGFKFNASASDFFSSGQIPLDEVAEGRLDRFGFIDPNVGGNLKHGTPGYPIGVTAGLTFHLFGK